MGEGLKEIQNQASRKGLLYSGRLLKELEEYGQGLANQTYGQRLSHLADLVQRGYDASGQISAVNANQGTLLADLLKTKGLAASDIYSNTGSGLASIYTNLGQSNLGAYSALGSQAGEYQRQLGDNIANLEAGRGLGKSDILLQSGQILEPYKTTSTTTGSSKKFEIPQQGQGDLSIGDRLKLGGASAGISGALAGISFLSSKLLKDEINSDITQERILAGIDILKIPTWKYFDSNNPHIGPYAEDVQKLFGVGNGKELPVVDMFGILFVIIKDLKNKVRKLEETANGN